MSESGLAPPFHDRQATNRANLSARSRRFHPHPGPKAAFAAEKPDDAICVSGQPERSPGDLTSGGIPAFPALISGGSFPRSGEGRESRPVG